ncbi:MAG: DUF4168 domain-containing protein [Rhodospirillaceae bacterium]|jgi:hypothetical protein|nr:DUF4168 domain-containing protein [Rhodospirillaceae bacterium]MBT6404326.1 DUF4168 domain-containing protein [Rhodospirillaceae bacterium]MBT6537102.1 DUF4168 domain-containing protein [Rhodospirillaceae bacterium]
MTDRVTGWLAVLAGAGAMLAAMTALSAPAALAQGLAQQTTTENAQQARVAPPNVSAAGVPGAATGTYDGRTLDAFARATRIVGALRNEYSPKIAVANIAGRPDRAEALFDEMRARMHDAIDATGLTIETYEAIASRAEHDRVLRARIEAIMTGARPPADPGLGVQAPQSAPITSVSREPNKAEDALAAAKDEIESLHRRLDTERTRARVAQERAVEDAAALRLSLEGAIERLTLQVTNQTPDEDTRAEVEALRVAEVRHDLARAALMREITGLAREFASAGEAMAALGTDLAANPSPDVVPLARLDARPVLLAGSLPTLARDLTAVQSRDGLRARLEAEQTRNLTLRARHAGERVALRREIDRIARDLAAATAALEDIGGLARAGLKPAPTENLSSIGVGAGLKPARDFEMPSTEAADPMHDQETYDVMAPVTASAEDESVEMIAMVPPALEIPVLAQPSLEHPPVPAAPVIRTGSVLAGIRAYETKNYARAYEVWQPLAAAGEASAQFHLGALYFEGRGVRQDLAQARRWLRAALDQGQERARFLLGRVETQLATTG